MFHISTKRPIFCSHYSSQIPILHSSVLTSQVRNPLYTPQWNALPYIGKFDGQAALGIYGLAATCGRNNTNQTLQPVALNINIAHTPYNVATAALRLQPVYGYCQSTVAANLQVAATLRLRPIYGYSQSTVAATLLLRPIYGYSKSTFAANLWLQPVYDYGHSTVVANLRLWPIYGCSHSILLLGPLCPLQLQFCYI